MSAIQLLQSPVEEVVSAHLGRAWRASDVRDMADFASRPSVILSGDGYAVFSKFSDASDAREQFEAELDGLRALTALSGVVTPVPIGIYPLANGHALVLEAVAEVPRTTRDWRQIGEALARIHTVRGSAFGYSRPGWFGPLPQDNTPAPDWPTFFGERRLRPGLRRAVDSGHLPMSLIRELEDVIARLPDLCGPSVAPTLLHGDAQKNNFISSPSGPVVIDPAIYFGHPEVDLAHIDYFEPVPEGFFDGYRSLRPIDPGFRGRRGLWRLWGYLACVTVEGRAYLPHVMEAVRLYR
jgi:fructosamine-3-kinase